MISKYVFKVFKKMDTQENFEICSKSINTLEKIKWCHSDVVNAKFEQITPYCSLVIVDMDIRKLSINSDMLRGKPQKHENHGNMETAIISNYIICH